MREYLEHDLTRLDVLADEAIARIPSYGAEAADTVIRAIELRMQIVSTIWAFEQRAAGIRVQDDDA